VLNNVNAQDEEKTTPKDDFDGETFGVCSWIKEL